MKGFGGGQKNKPAFRRQVAATLTRTSGEVLTLTIFRGKA
jgi:hypothetical protein